MSIYKDNATGRWRFDFDHRVDGVRIRRRQLLPAGFTRAEAEAFDRKEGAALWSIAHGTATPRHFIGEAVALYLRERVPGLKAGQNAKREIDAWKPWWDGRLLEELAAICQKYAADQAGALKPATIKNRIAYLRAACRWAWKRHSWGDQDPGARVIAPEVNNARSVTVTRRDVLRLARACRHRGVRALILIAFYSGMRVSEIQRARRTHDAFILLDTKNGEPRIVPMLPVIRAAASIKMPTRSEIDYWWPLARKQCGLSHLHLHDLRHAHATELVNAGVDLSTVGRILGHKSAASTQRYAHHSVEFLRRAMLSGLARKAG